MEKLFKQVFEDHKVDYIHFDIPEALTREVYVQVIRKLLACIRKEAYEQVQTILKKDGKERMEKEDFNELMRDIGEKN